MLCRSLYLHGSNVYDMRVNEVPDKLSHKRVLSALWTLCPACAYVDGTSNPFLYQLFKNAFRRHSQRGQRPCPPPLDTTEI